MLLVLMIDPFHDEAGSSMFEVAARVFKDIECEFQLQIDFPFCSEGGSTQN